jgi:hypothetical protein
VGNLRSEPEWFKVSEVNGPQSSPKEPFPRKHENRRATNGLTEQIEGMFGGTGCFADQEGEEVPGIHGVRVTREIREVLSKRLLNWTACGSCPVSCTLFNSALIDRILVVNSLSVLMASTTG